MAADAPVPSAPERESTTRNGVSGTQTDPLRPLLRDPAVARALGMLMATIPSPARVAEQVLTSAAELAGVSAVDLAHAMTAGSGGTEGAPVPAPVERALRRAVQAAREAAPAPGAGRWPRLLPSRQEAEQALARFFDARVRLSAVPDDDDARRTVEDTLFTLCVLMAQPSAYAAVRDAVQYVDS
ncbi:DUF5133 domain-containing protein [Streptomyces sp. NPDC023588]|uniref:DUF5133 domain-containing protein n=1 Tax=Streptomyces sp. NPDC023588 TaxID=3154907 RepID=UPI0033ED8818